MNGRKVHNEELHNLHPSSNIIKMVKLRRMRLGRAYRTHGGRRKMHTWKVLVEGFKEETTRKI
jgi:hypothetical protein